MVEVALQINCERMEFVNKYCSENWFSYRKNKSLPHVHIPFVLCTKINVLCFKDLNTILKTFRNKNIDYLYDYCRKGFFRHDTESSSYKKLIWLYKNTNLLSYKRKS